MDTTYSISIDTDHPDADQIIHQATSEVARLLMEDYTAHASVTLHNESGQPIAEFDNAELLDTSVNECDESEA